MSDKVRGNRVLSGTWGEVWIDGDKIFELSKIEMKITANREDIQFDLSVDSKITGLKGEFTLGVKKVYSRYTAVFEDWKKGIDKRVQIITKLQDPDAAKGQIERYATDNCWFNELPMVNYEKGGIIDEEISGGFTPSDMLNLDKIAV